MCSFRQAGIKQHLSNSGLDYGRLQREIINKYPAKWNLIATVTHTQSYSPINKVNVQPTYHLLQSTLFWEHVDEAKHLTFNVFTQTPYAQAPIYSLKYPKVFTFSSAQFDPVDFLQFNSTWRKRLVKKRKKKFSPRCRYLPYAYAWTHTHHSQQYPISLRPTEESCYRTGNHSGKNKNTTCACGSTMVFRVHDSGFQ